MKRTVHKRAGMLLVEVLLCMAMGAILVTVATAIFTRVIMANPAAREHLNGTLELGRLSRQFRRDVHAAIEVSEGGEGPKLTLHNSSVARVVYELEGDAIRRTEIDGDKTLRREQFALEGMKVLGWKIQTGTQQVSLLIGRLAAVTSGSEEQSVRYRLPLTARWGLDQRFASLGASGQAGASND